MFLCVSLRTCQLRVHLLLSSGWGKHATKVAKMALFSGRVTPPPLESVFDSHQPLLDLSFIDHLQDGAPYIVS